MGSTSPNREPRPSPCWARARAGQGAEYWSLQGALKKGSQWLLGPGRAEPGCGPLSLRGPGLLAGTARAEQAGQDGWRGAGEETSWGRMWRGAESQPRAQGTLFSAQSTVCPQLTHSRVPAPRCLAPAWHRSRSTASESFCLRRRLAAAQAAQTDTRSRSVSPYRRPDHGGMPESQARRQRPPSVPGRPASLPPARPPRPPSPAADQWKAYDRPSTPQSSWAQTPPPQSPPTLLEGLGQAPPGCSLGQLLTPGLQLK